MKDLDKLVLAMALTRLLAGSLELTGALFMLAFNRVETAFRINALLGLVGPFVFLLVSALGFSGLVGKIAPGKIALLIIGISLILASAKG